MIDVETAPPIRIAFVVTGLALGGAEMMLWRILSHLDRKRFEPYVIALSTEGDALAPRFRDAGINCSFIGMRSALDAPRGLCALIGTLRRLQPDIVQGWMYQANIAATLAGRMAVRGRPILWAVRAGLTDLALEKWHVALPIRLGGMLSRIPHRIINNSVASAAEHESALGYSREKRCIVPNGFDIELFSPSREARRDVRAELSLDESTPLVGLIARYHWVKDHGTFLRAAREVSVLHPAARYVLVGDNVDDRNAALGELIARNNLADRVHLLGRRHDVARVMGALDVAVSSSVAEGFSNVIGEAMSCGVPCVATDVGDAAAIIRDTGRIVPPRDPPALARAIGELLAVDPSARTALGAAARNRIVKCYSLPSIVRAYEQLYESVHRASGQGAGH